jgi:hypothetical protein
VTQQWIGSEALVEQPNSPAWDFGDAITATVTYKGPFSVCLANAPRKGALGLGDYAGLVVTSAKVTKEKGGIGVLVIVYGGLPVGETQVPSDLVSVQQRETNLRLALHPRYANLSISDRAACETFAQSWNKGDDWEWEEFAWVLDDPQLTEYSELLARGVEAFMFRSPVYEWATHYIDEPWQDSGLYPEDPWGPVTAPLGFEWLRMPDQLEWTGTFWKLTRRWIAALQVAPELYPIAPYPE